MTKGASAAQTGLSPSVEPVPPRIKHTCAAVGKTVHDKRKARREISMKRSEAAIRFFMKPENASAIEARRAETHSGSVHESAGPKDDAQGAQP